MDDYYERLNQAFANWNGGEPSLDDRVAALESEMLQKQNILTFDSEPVEDSENPVTSGGLFSQFERYATKVDLNGKVDASNFTADQDRQETEIGVVANAGAKNQFNIDAAPTVNHTDYTLTDGKLTVGANGNWAHYSVPVELPAGDYILSMTISDYIKVTEAPDASMRLRMSATTSGGPNVVLQTINGDGTMSVPFTWTGGALYLQFYSNYNAASYANSFSAERVMIRRAEITDSTYVPYAPTNRELYEMILALQSGS